MDRGKIWLIVTTLKDENSDKTFSMAYSTTSRKRRDEIVKDYQDDIDAGATYKSYVVHEIESLSCENLWVGNFPDNEQQ